MTSYCDLCGNEFDAEPGSAAWCQCVTGIIETVDEHEAKRCSVV